MSKIATMRQVCQLAIDHSQAFDSKITFQIKFRNSYFIIFIDLHSQITKDSDLSYIIKQFIILYIVQYVRKSRIESSDIYHINSNNFSVFTRITL